MTNALSPQDVIKIIAQNAAAIGWQAGVGACETAGQIVSYLAANPEKWDAFVKDGIFAFDADEPGAPWWRNGCLSWQGADGKIWHPQDARLAAVVASMRP